MTEISGQLCNFRNFRTAGSWCCSSSGSASSSTGWTKPFVWAEWVFRPRYRGLAWGPQSLQASEDTSPVHSQHTAPLPPHDPRSCVLHETSCSEAHTEPSTNNTN